MTNELTLGEKDRLRSALRDVEYEMRILLSSLRSKPPHTILARLKAVPARNRGMTPNPAVGWAAEFDRRRARGEAIPSVEDCRRVCQ